MAIQVAAGEVLVDEAPVGSAITTMGSAEGSPTRIPVSRYTSTDFAALEAERLWPRVWQIACSVDHVAQPGDFFEYRVGAYAVLIVRGDDGELRAFQNVCRHRGNAALQRLGIGSERVALRLPPLVLGPAGPAPGGAVAPGFRPSAQRGLSPAGGQRRHLGTDRVRQPRS